VSAVIIEGLEGLVERINRMALRSVEAAATSAAAGAEYVHRIMVTQHLNGQSIGRRDHALIQGWNVRKITSPPGAILGTGVPYAHAQEYGFRGEVQIPAHKRRNALPRRRAESRRAFTKRRTAFQESPAGAATVEVRAHPRRMRLRPRRFLRGAIEDARPDLSGIMESVWRRELAG